MTANPLEAAIRQVLNDRRIFGMAEQLIGEAKWSEFREALRKNDKTRIGSILESSENAINAHISKERDDKKRERLQEARKLLIGLKACISKDSILIHDLADQIDSFGPLRFNLPNMEDFGKIIEGHSRPVAEQFFLYKIDKEKDQRRRAALAALLDVVKGLYEKRVDPLEIAFFVRKMESLTQIMEVLKWQ